MARTCIDQVLDIGISRPALVEARQRCLDRIRALAKGFTDQIGRTIDDIDIVADTTDHQIITSSAVERVVPRAAVERIITDRTGKRVGSRIASDQIVATRSRARECTRPRKGEVFDIGDVNARKRESTESRLDRIRTLARNFKNDVIRSVNDKHIVPATAR